MTEPAKKALSLDEAIGSLEGKKPLVYDSPHTLLDLVGQATVTATTNKLTQIDMGGMQEAVAELRITKSRPLTGKYWAMLDDVARNKNFNIGHDDEIRMQMLQGLYALEYINGEVWYNINPLLENGLKSYRETMANEKKRLADND